MTGVQTCALPIYYSSVKFDKVTLADFSNPKLVIEVKGNLSADGSKVIAKVIKLDN